MPTALSVLRLNVFLLLWDVYYTLSPYAQKLHFVDYFAYIYIGTAILCALHECMIYQFTNIFCIGWRRWEGCCCLDSEVRKVQPTKGPKLSETQTTDFWADQTIHSSELYKVLKTDLFPIYGCWQNCKPRKVRSRPSSFEWQRRHVFFACQTYHSHHSSPGVQQNLGNWCLRDTRLVVVPLLTIPICGRQKERVKKNSNGNSQT